MDGSDTLVGDLDYRIIRTLSHTRTNSRNIPVAHFLFYVNREYFSSIGWHTVRLWENELKCLKYKTVSGDCVLTVMK